VSCALYITTLLKVDPFTPPNLLKLCQCEHTFKIFTFVSFDMVEEVSGSWHTNHFNTV